LKTAIYLHFLYTKARVVPDTSHSNLMDPLTGWTNTFMEWN